jgi:hypothetical protein
MNDKPNKKGLRDEEEGFHLTFMQNLIFLDDYNFFSFFLLMHTASHSNFIKREIANETSSS